MNVSNAHNVKRYKCVSAYIRMVDYTGFRNLNIRFFPYAKPILEVCTIIMRE